MRSDRAGVWPVKRISTNEGDCVFVKHEGVVRLCEGEYAIDHVLTGKVGLSAKGAQYKGTARMSVLERRLSDTYAQDCCCAIRCRRRSAYSRTSERARLGKTNDARKIGKSLFPVHR
jgi:hypothetical protein